MTISAATKLEAHPPLARDSFGNLLGFPNGTHTWRICRETTGRPREIRGPDRLAIRFPLETTTDDLVELCGAGMYRVYALDELGAQLEDEHIAKWDLTPGGREHRNGAPDAPLLALRPTGGPATVTDVRFALEAMTQMMRTNSEALRIVTDSHVDLAKAVVTAKGLRNAIPLAPLSVIESDGEQDDEEEDEMPKSHPVVELLMPFAQKAADMMPGLVMGKVMAGAGPADARTLVSGDESASSRDAGLAERPRFELRDLVDLQYAKRKGDAKRAAREPAERTRAEMMAALQARIMADPALVQHLIAIKEQLDADEVQTLMNVVGSSTEAQQSEFIAAIKALPGEAAVEFCRDVVTAIRTQSAQ